MYNISTLQQLPPCPGKHGWPWNEQVEPEIYNCADNWPKISVITPSFNQGAYIEETIRSIVLQNYPNVEYIIIDGGSTDETISVIQKYEQWINYWVSEKDNGQSEAIQKGLDKCSGIIFNWINSDDVLAKDALYNIALSYMNNTALKVITGGCNHFNDNGPIGPAYVKDLTFEGMIGEYSWFQQPSQWIVLKNTGALTIDPNLHYAFDWAMILNLNLQSHEISYLPVVLSHFRYHEQSKTTLFDERFKQEKLLIVKSYLKKVSSFSKKVTLYKYLFRLYCYLTVNSYLTSTKKAGLVALLSLAVRKPKLMFSKFYLGQLRKLINE